MLKKISSRINLEDGYAIESFGGINDAYYLTTPQNVIKCSSQSEAEEWYIKLRVKEQYFSIIDSFFEHLDQLPEVSICIPLNWKWELEQCYEFGFCNYFLHDAYLEYIHNSCSRAYKALHNWKQGHKGLADFEIDEMCEILNQLIELVCEYCELMETIKAETSSGDFIEEGNQVPENV